MYLIFVIIPIYLVSRAEYREDNLLLLPTLYLFFLHEIQCQVFAVGWWQWMFTMRCYLQDIESWAKTNTLWFRHQLAALKIHCESQALAAWGTLRPWERGVWNPQKCPESKVQCSYPHILICIDNDIQRHYPLCPLYSYVTVSWDTWNVLGHRVYTYIFFGHTFSIRTQVWWEMLRRDKKPLGQGGFTILAPELATESTWGVSGVCVNMGNTYEGVTSIEGGQ